MTSPVHLLIHGPTGTYVLRTGGVEGGATGGPVEVPDAADAADAGAAALAAAVREVLTELGWRGRPVALALDGGPVFGAPVETGGLPRRDRRTGLLYRIEEHVPLDAEQLTADTAPPVGGRALGVAVETVPLKATLDALAAAGIEVATAAPLALLAAWEPVGRGPDRDGFILVTRERGADLVRLVAGRPVAWAATSGEADEIARAVALDLVERAPEDDGADGEAIEVVGPLPPETARAVEARTGLAVRPAADADVVARVGRAAALRLAGRDAGWVELCRDALAPAGALERVARPIRVAAVLVLVLLAAVAGAAHWRAARYDAVRRGLEAGQAETFARLSPNQPVPLAVRPRLESDLKRLDALSGAGTDAPRAPSALATLDRVLAALPDDLRVRVLDLRIAPSGVVIEGQVRRHTDAETVGAALARDAGYAVEAPRTERLAKGGAAFTLVGHPAGGAADGAGAGSGQGVAP